MTEMATEFVIKYRNEGGNRKKLAQSDISMDKISPEIYINIDDIN